MQNRYEGETMKKLLPSPLKEVHIIVYLYISRTTAHKGHVLSFPNAVSIYSSDCIFRTRTMWAKYKIIEDMGVRSAIGNVNLQNAWHTQTRYPQWSTVRLSLLIYDTTPPHPHPTLKIEPASPSPQPGTFYFYMKLTNE